MSQKNVDIVRRALDGFLSAGYDMRNAEDFFEVADPGIEFDISRTNPEAQVYGAATASSRRWSSGSAPGTPTKWRHSRSSTRHRTAL